MGGRILASPIEMVSHPYNSAALPRSLWLWKYVNKAVRSVYRVVHDARAETRMVSEASLHVWHRWAGCHQSSRKIPLSDQSACLLTISNNLNLIALPDFTKSTLSLSTFRRQLKHFYIRTVLAFEVTWINVLYKLIKSNQIKWYLLT